MKLSKSRILFYLIVIVIFLFDLMILKPIVDEKYFYYDIDNFKDSSWNYSVILFVILFLSFIIYISKKSLLTKVNFFYGLFLIGLLAFSLKGLNDNLLLYLNTKIDSKKTLKTFSVIRYDPNKVFHIYDNKNEFIVFQGNLRKIDSLRKVRKLKSLFLLQNKDTIKVPFKEGFLNIKYLD